MPDAGEESLDQRRKTLQAELAAQRALIERRLAPRPDAATTEPTEHSALGLSGAYPRSMTLRLAQRHAALALGLVTLAATLLIRGQREQLDEILSIAKAVEPLFSGQDPPV